MNYSRRPVRRAAVGVLAGTLALTGGAIVAGVSPANALPGFAAERLQGVDRFQTAADIAVSTFGTADTVVLARSDDFPDALTGNYLAGINGAPLLLTETANLTEATSVALNTLDAQNVIIVGETAAVSDAVEADLDAQGYNVRRLGGLDRYKTAELIANDAFGTGVGTVGAYNGLDTAVLGSGEDFPDVLAAGPLSFAEKFPITITFPTDLPQETINVYADLGIEQVIVVGGTDAVSQSVRDEVETLTGNPVVVLADQTRAGTAVAIADFAYDELGFDTAHINLARSDDFADALAGGPHGGFESAPIVITASGTLTTDTEDFLTARATTLETGNIFGGTAAVSTAVEDAAVAAAQTVTTNQTFTVTPAEAAANTVSAGTPNENRGVRTYTVDTGSATVVDIALIPADEVTDTSGVITFGDNEGTANTADDLGAADGAVIETVNGADVTDADYINNSAPINGSLTFTVDSTVSNISVRPVVFTDANNDNQLNLVVPTTANTNPKAPTEAFGVGGVTNFIAVEVASGVKTSVAVVATSISKADKRFAGNGDVNAEDGTYIYDSNDTFQLAGVPITLAQFEGLLSDLDIFDATYTTNRDLPSTFNITTDDVIPPTSATATVSNLDSGATANDVTVAWVPGTDVQSDAVYDIYRAPDATCTEADTLVKDNATGTSTALNNQADGTYFYCAAAQGATSQELSTFVVTASTAVPLSADTVAPAAIDTIQTTNAGLSSTLDAGDVVKIVFNEAIGAPVTGDTIRVTDTDTSPSVGDIINGTNAAFTLNAAAETVNGVSRAANIVLTITLSGDPTVVNGGTALGIQQAATIIDQAGTADLAGNLFDPNPAGSQDVVIEQFGVDTQNNSFDTSAPAAPNISGSDDSVNANDYPIAGTAEAGSTVKVLKGATLVGTGPADATTGAYSIVVPLTQNAANSFTATATDAANNTSTASNTRVITEDSIAPTVVSAAGVDGGAGIVDSVTVTFSEAITCTTAGFGQFSYDADGVAGSDVVATVISCSGSVATLTFPTATFVPSSATDLVRYTQSGTEADRIKDVTGNDATSPASSAISG